MGRGARAEAKLKVRQPLAEAVVACPPALAERIGSLVDLVADELNVRAGALRDRPGRAGRRDPEAELPPPRPPLRRPHARGRRGRRRPRAGRGRARPRRRRGRSRSRSTAAASGSGRTTSCARRAPPRATPSARTPPWRSASPPRSPPPCASRRWRARSCTRCRAPGARPACGWRSASALHLDGSGLVREAIEAHRAEIAAETLAVELSVSHGAPFAGIHHEEHVIEGEPLALRLDRAGEA